MAEVREFNPLITENEQNKCLNLLRMLRIKYTFRDILFQGDIIMTEKEIRNLIAVNARSTRGKRQAVKYVAVRYLTTFLSNFSPSYDPSTIWPNAVVYYAYDNTLRMF